MRPFSSISTFLITGLGLLCVLAALALWLNADRTTRQLGNYAMQTSAETIRAQTYDALSSLLQAHTANYNAIFTQALADSRLLATQAKALLDNAAFYGQKNSLPEESIIPLTNGYFAATGPETMHMLACCGPEALQDMQQESNVLSHIGPVLASMQDSHSSYAAAWAAAFCSPARPDCDSFIIRYAAKTDYASSMQQAPDAAPRQSLRSSDLLSGGAQNNAPRWTLFYTGDARPRHMLMLAHPVYSQNGTYYGAAGLDIALEDIEQDIMAKNTQGAASNSMMLDRAFYLLADATGGVLAMDYAKFSLVGLSLPRVDMEATTNLHSADVPAISELADSISRKQRGRAFLEVNEENYAVFWRRMTALDWTVVLFIPEVDLFASLRQAQSGIGQAVEALRSRHTAISLTVVAAVFILTLTLLWRRLFRPLHQLNRSLDMFARGEQGQMHSIGAPGDELRHAADSVQSMAAVVHYTNQKLNEAESSYRSLLETIASGVCQISEDGTLLAANPSLAQMLGYSSKEELLDAVPSVAAVFAEPSRYAVFMNQAHSEGGVQGFEAELKRTDSSPAWVAINARPVQDSKNTVKYIQIVLDDITEQKLAVQDLLALNDSMVRAQETNRRHVASVLHEDVAQDLATAKVFMAGLEQELSTLERRDTWLQYMKLSSLLDRALLKVRDISQELLPPELETKGLGYSLDALCRDMTRQSNTVIHFTASGVGGMQMDHETAIHVYRIAQEALHNALEHSQATEIMLTLAHVSHEVVMRIRDNGPRFDQDQRPRLGLRSLQERAKHVGGRFTFEPSSGNGSKLTLTFPLQNQA